MDIKISTSILNSDMSKLGQQIKLAEDAGTHYIHLDVMDGIFVDNLTFGNVVVQSLRPHTTLPFDTHLMVEYPERLIPLFAAAGSDIITIHVESKVDVKKALHLIKSHGIKAGLSIKPATPADKIFPYLDEVDMILVMTVEPGEGGQGFIRNSLDKIRIIRDELTKRGLDTDIEVDGGINAQTAKEVIDAGANVLVSGTYLYNAEDMMSEAMRSLINPPSSTD